MAHNNRRWAVALLSSVAAMFVSAAIAILVGSHSLNFERALQGLSPDHEILMQLRIPRAPARTLDRRVTGLIGRSFPSLAA